MVTPDASIGVAQDSSLVSMLRGREHGLLSIGMVALHQMTVGELRTVLCHEYGHFSHRHTRWGPFDRALGSAFETALRQLPGPRRWQPYSVDWVVQFYRAMAALNPAYWLLYAVVHFHYRIVAAYRRLGEVQADLTALNLGGADAFASSLVRSAVNAQAFHQVVEPAYVQQIYNHGWISHRFSAICSDQLNALDGRTMQRLAEEAQAETGLRSEFDSHPPLTTRLNYARRFVSSAAPDDRPVKALFDNWDDLDERLAAAYHADVRARIFGR
jgi:Zn-dependent protease with chaperone function